MRKATYDNLGALLNGIILDCWRGSVENGQIDVSLRKRFVDPEGTKYYVLDAQYSFTPVGDGHLEQRRCSDPTIRADSNEEATSQEFAESAGLMLEHHGVLAKQEGDSVRVFGRELCTRYMTLGEAVGILNAAGDAIAPYHVDRIYRALHGGREPNNGCINGRILMDICRRLKFADGDILPRLHAHYAPLTPEIRKVS